MKIFIPRPFVLLLTVSLTIFVGNQRYMHEVQCEIDLSYHNIIYNRRQTQKLADCRPYRTHKSYLTGNKEMECFIFKLWNIRT
jgi:hypothetical protein